MLNGDKVTSYDIKVALSDYNVKDYFITECKTDSTYFAGPQGLLIFDGLAIKKSYTQPCITGYEIKISRSDFQRDNKYHLYLQYCNEFYFVVPAGMLKKEEIPDDMGLIYYYPETGRLVKKKKALFRKIDDPIGVYKYIIFSRLERERTPFYSDREEYAKAYLEDKEDKRMIGRMFGSKMAKDLMDAYGRLDRMKNAESKLNLCEELLKVMHKNGLYCWRDESYAEKLDSALHSTVKPDDLEALERDLTHAAKLIAGLRGEASTEGGT